MAEPRIYRIIRFRFGWRGRTLRNNVTLSEARAHCARPETSSHSAGPGAWFDGYDYMPGCRPDPDPNLTDDDTTEALAGLTRGKS